MTLMTFFPYILYVNDVITPGAVNFRIWSEQIEISQVWRLLEFSLADRSITLHNVNAHRYGNVNGVVKFQYQWGH